VLTRSAWLVAGPVEQIYQLPGRHPLAADHGLAVDVDGQRGRGVGSTRTAAQTSAIASAAVGVWVLRSPRLSCVQLRCSRHPCPSGSERFPSGRFISTLRNLALPGPAFRCNASPSWWRSVLAGVGTCAFCRQFAVRHAASVMFRDGPLSPFVSNPTAAPSALGTRRGSVLQIPHRPADKEPMPRDITTWRCRGEGSIGLWPRQFEQDTPIMNPDHPWAASAGREERVFKTFRAAVDFLYFETRGTQYREPTTEQFEFRHG